MIKRFIRKNKDYFYGGGEIVGNITNKELIDGVLGLTEYGYTVKKISTEQLDDICLVVVDDEKKEVRFLKEFYITEIIYNKIFENIEQAEEYRNKFGGTTRCFSNELRDKRQENIDEEKFEFTTLGGIYENA